MSPWWGIRNLARHRARSLLAVAGIAVAAALLLDMVLLAGGLERSFEELLLSRGYQIRLAPKGTFPFDSEATLTGVGALVESIRRDPQVAEAGAMLVAPIHARTADTLLPITGYGVDPRGQAVYEVERGNDLAAHDTAGALLGALVAAALGADLGDTVTLVGRLDPQAATASAERRLVVRGLVRWIYDDREMRSIGVPLSVLQTLGFPAGQDRASLVAVRAREDSLAPALAARLAAAHPDVTVASIADIVAGFRDRLAYFRQLSVILATISLTVTVLLVATILTITVNERLLEIATLRALGVSRRSVVIQVLVEGAALTGAGAALGILLGIVTARYLDAILTTFPGLPATASFFVTGWDGLSAAAAVLLATGVLAGAGPAWLAARAPIAATLRGETT